MPAAVDDLSASFHTDLLVGAKKLVFHYFDISWRLPFPLAAHFDAFFAMDDSIVQDPCNTDPITLGRIRVQHNLSVLQPAVSKRTPLHFAYGARSGSTWTGLGRGKPKDSGIPR